MWPKFAKKRILGFKNRKFKKFVVPDFAKIRKKDEFWSKKIGNSDFSDFPDPDFAKINFHIGIGLAPPPFFAEIGLSALELNPFFRLPLRVLKF